MPGIIDNGALDQHYYRRGTLTAGSGSLTLEPTGTGDGLSGNDATYATARSGAGAIDNATQTVRLGQTNDYAGVYGCSVAFVEFDTTTIPTGASISSVTLKAYSQGDNTTTDFVMEVRAFDFGATVEDGDWVAGADWDSTGTLVAQYDTSGGWVGNSQYTFTSEAAFLTAIDKGGYTRLMIGSDRFAAGTTPTGDEYGWIGLTEPGYEMTLEVIW